MPKAITTPTTAGATALASTRRHVLGGAALAALTGGAFGAAIVLPNPGEAFPAAISPDAELIRLCAEVEALQARMDALYAVPRPDTLSNAQHLALEKARDVLEKPLADAQDPLLERICVNRRSILTPIGAQG